MRLAATSTARPACIGVDIGPVVDVGDRIRIVGQPCVDPDAPSPDGDEGVAVLVDRVDLQHLGNGADHRSIVAAAGLPTVGDECLAELGFAVGTQAVADHVAVARLEDVQRQDAPGQQHGPQREHRHDGHARR